MKTLSIDWQVAARQLLLEIAASAEVSEFFRGMALRLVKQANTEYEAQS